MFDQDSSTTEARLEGAELKIKGAAKKIAGAVTGRDDLADAGDAELSQGREMVDEATRQAENNSARLDAERDTRPDTGG